VHGRSETLISRACWLMKFGTEYERNKMIDQCFSDGNKYETSPVIVNFMNNSTLHNPNDADFVSRCRQYSLNPRHYDTGFPKVPELNSLRHNNSLHLHSTGLARIVWTL
jgi:hypothetical protein